VILRLLTISSVLMKVRACCLCDSEDKWRVGVVGLDGAEHDDFGCPCFREILRSFHVPPLPPLASLREELSAHELAIAC
jgi:hypothetical protein